MAHKGGEANKGKVPGADEDDKNDCAGPGGTIDLLGKWQNCVYLLLKIGSYQRNSSLRVPKDLVLFILKLKINYAFVMVGFELRNGRSFSIYNAIVVCTEFKDAILEVYAEEDVWWGAEERRKNAAQAISRWYQLILDVSKWPCSVDYDGIGWEFKGYLANLLKKPITIEYRFY
nr:hypothetical protein [Tanacetum cinerariifolium]